MSQTSKTNKIFHLFHRKDTRKHFNFKQLFKSKKEIKTSQLCQTLEVIESPSKELTEDEKCDLEVFSILNGTPDADQFFHYDGDEIVVDKNVFFRNDYFIDTEDY